MNTNRFYLVALLAFIAAPLSAAKKAVPPPSPYQVIQKIPLPGDGTWDYLTADPEGRRLYVAHDTQVQVLDLDSLQLVGEIHHLKGAHGVALATDLGRGFISVGKDNSVVVFELKTRVIVDTFKRVGKNPDAILFDPATEQIFTLNSGSYDATALNAGSGKVKKYLDLGGKPEFGMADGEGIVYVNLQDASKLLKIDSRKLTILERWDLAPCKEPTALTMDRSVNRVFVGCRNQQMVAVDTTSGKVVASLPIGAQVDGAAFDSASGLIYFSSGDGTLTIIQEESEDNFHVVDTVTTQAGARTMAFDPKTHRVFLATADFGPVPEATRRHPNPRPPILPGTFAILVIAPHGK